MRFFLTIAFSLFVGIIFGQVNLQNGSGYYQIPIFSFADGKSGLSSEISLNYSTGNGLIVSNRASNTGQNWSLVTGGTISRKQNGEPDDQNSIAAFPIMPVASLRGYNSKLAYYDVDQLSWGTNTSDPYSRNYIDNYYPNGYLYTEFTQEMVEPDDNNFPIGHMAPREIGILPRFKSNMDKRYLQSRRSLADHEQDVFSFEFNGYSGEFVISKDGNIQLLTDSKIKISKTTADLTSQNIRTRINEFLIVDEKGIYYKFSAYELSEAMATEEMNSYGFPSFTMKVLNGVPKGKYTIQKWFLTEIANPETLEKIVFNYETYDVDIEYNRSLLYQNTIGENSENVQLSVNRMRGKFKRVNQVNFPDGHKVDVIYNMGMIRHDFPQDNPVQKITLSYQNQEVYAHEFEYGYFFKKEIRSLSTAIYEAEKPFTRLCLKSVKKTTPAGLAEPAYKFDYYTGANSPDLKVIVAPTGCMAEDHWGYYTTNTNLDIFSPWTKEAYKDFLLNSATYRQPSAGTASLGLIKSVESPLGGKLTFEYEQNEAKDADNPTISKIQGGIRVSKTILSDGTSPANDIATNYYYKASDGTTSGWGYETPHYLLQRNIKVWNAGNLEGYTNAGNSQSQFNSLAKSTLGAVKGQVMKAGFKAMRGIKVKCIVPQLILFDMAISGFLQRAFQLFNSTDYYNINIYNFNSFESRNPIGVNYSRVEVANTSIVGGSGKTVYEFSKPSVVRNEIPVLAMPYSEKERFPSWKYGNLIKTQVYNQAGTLLKETVNNYNIVVNQLNTDNNNRSLKVELLRSHSASCQNNTGTGAVPLTDFSWEYYFPIKGHAELTSTTETNYSAAGIAAQQTATVTYNNNYLPQTSTTTKSNGDQIVVKTYYANDYGNISTAIQEMKIRNMISVPISTETWLIKPNSNQYLIDATINEYFVHYNNDIKLGKIYKLETKEPLLSSVIGTQSSTSLIRNTTYFKEKGGYIYNLDGVAVETYTPEGDFNTQLVDFNQRITVASVSNAHRYEVAYSSFETTEKGNWAYDLAYVTQGDAVMGNKFYKIPSGSVANITIPWTVAKDARLSFWKKGALPTVTYGGGALSPVKTVANNATGWIYYEYNFSGINTLTISNSSSTDFLSIDELRLYPKEGRMTSIAYDPIKGKTADCDVNNRIRYYEYDGLYRLSYVRDEQKNILKKICYNYAGEPENCLDNDATPQWRDIGLTQCEACAANPAYNSGVKLKQQMDNNPLSSTYQQLKWIADPDNNCPTPPDIYQRTDLATCEVVNGIMTGNYIIPTVDINPCSPTYNQWATPVIISNHPACITCSPTCTGINYKCINGVCVQGTYGVIKSRKVDRFTWWCSYAYCFPDGTTSSIITTTVESAACNIICP